MLTNSFLKEYPIQAVNRIHEWDVVNYFACLIKVAGADSLSPSEKEAIIKLIDFFQDSADIFDKAIEKIHLSFNELLGNCDVLKIIAPFLIRDSIMISFADNRFTPEEEDKMLEMASVLKVSENMISIIYNAFNLYLQAEEEWNKVLDMGKQ
ncbi:MAG: hypothetical protein K8R77_16560 [Anaerolineaceae bacterium]|nr:hypothetical protein [Anaerolineaceae bacterium]